MGEVFVAIGYSDTEILMERDGIFDFIANELNVTRSVKKVTKWKKGNKERLRPC